MTARRGVARKVLGGETGHPLRGVLVTRPMPEAMATAVRVGALGFLPIVAPILEIRPRSLSCPPDVNAVLVTSSNALQALPRALHALPLLTVGAATARRAYEAGFRRVQSADGDAIALAALAARTLPPGASVLLAVGTGQGVALAAMLREGGFRVHRRAVYAARPVRAFPCTARCALQAGALHAALFLSAETSRAFAGLLPAPLSASLAVVDALAIGEPAAAALRLLPWRRVRVSAAPTLDGILALL